MTIEDKYDFVKKIWDEQMFISSSIKTESGEDKDIPFSKYDTKLIHIYKYKYKPDEISTSYTRVSHVFQWANEILEEWGYKYRERDKLHYNPGFLDKNYYWEHPVLHPIIINSNSFHKDDFRIDAKFSGNYFTVKSKKDIEKKIINTITWLIKDKKDKQLLRKLNLKNLLKEKI